MERQRTGLSRSYFASRRVARLRQLQLRQRLQELHRHSCELLNQQQAEESAYSIDGPFSLDLEEAHSDAAEAVAGETR